MPTTETGYRFLTDEENGGHKLFWVAHIVNLPGDESKIKGNRHRHMQCHRHWEIPIGLNSGTPEKKTTSTTEN